MIGNMDKCIDNRGEGYLSSIFLEIAGALGACSPEEAVRTFRSMMEEMQMQQPVSENREADLEVLTTSVNPIRLRNNPVELDTLHIKIMYANILQG